MPKIGGGKSSAPKMPKMPKVGGVGGGIPKAPKLGGSKMPSTPRAKGKMPKI